MSGHSRSGLTLLAAFSNTAHMERAKTRGSLGNKSQHNQPETEVVIFWLHPCKRSSVHVDNTSTGLFFLKTLCNALLFNVCFHFPPQWCRILRLYFCPQKQQLIRTDSWRGLVTRRSQMRNSKNTNLSRRTRSPFIVQQSRHTRRLPSNIYTV